MSAHSGDQLKVPSFIVNTGVDTSPGAVTMPEGESAAAMVLRSDAFVWSDVDYKSKYAD